MFPVVEFPRVKVCAFVVPKTPVPVRVVALFPELAEIVAVGVPESTLRTANLAEVVAWPPIRRSRVEFTGYKAPLVESHQLVVDPIANPQFEEFWIQNVPVSFGKVHVLAAVAADARVLRIFVVPAKLRFPLLRIVNLVAPLFEAVKISPTPVLSAIRAANDVAPEAEATAIVPPSVIFGLISKLARGDVAPIPTFPAGFTLKTYPELPKTFNPPAATESLISMITSPVP